MEKELQQTFEFYNHRILWSVAERNFQTAIAPTTSRVDAMSHALGAMLLYFFAFEGYLNWLGNRIAPEVWKEEKKFFSHPPYIGSLGKYCFLAKIVRLPTPDASQGPFQTAKEVLKLRHMAVHPKAEAGERLVKVADDLPPIGKLAEKVSPEKAVRAREHLFKLAEDLHRNAKSAYPELDLEAQAFDGVFSYSGTLSATF